MRAQVDQSGARDDIQQTFLTYCLEIFSAKLLIPAMVALTSSAQVPTSFMQLQTELSGSHCLPFASPHSREASHLWEALDAYTCTDQNYGTVNNLQGDCFTNGK